MQGHMPVAGGDIKPEAAAAAFGHELSKTMSPRTSKLPVPASFPMMTQGTSKLPMPTSFPTKPDPATGAPIAVHPFFLTFKCLACSSPGAAPKAGSGPDVRWTIPKAEDFETEEYRQVGGHVRV